MTVAQWTVEFYNALGDPAGTRFAGVGNAILYAAINDSQIWVAQRLPVNIMPNLQEQEIQAATVTNAFALPADYCCLPSVTYDGIPATYYARKKIVKNSYWASTPTDPCWTLDHGQYRILHTITTPIDIILEYIKNPTRIAAGSVNFDLPDSSHQVLLEKALNWICVYDRNTNDAATHLNLAIAGISDLRGGKPLEIFEDKE